MSAINPASFASPTLGIQAPSGVGPGAVGAGRSSSGGERRQTHQAQEQQSGAYVQGPQAARGFRAPFPQSFGGERPAATASGFLAANYAYGVGGVFANPRASASYAPSLLPGLEGFSHNGYHQAGDFQSMRQRWQASQGVSSPGPHSQGISPLPQNDWTANFQGLSLNTH